MRIFVLEDSGSRNAQFRQASIGAELCITTTKDQAVALFNPDHDLDPYWDFVFLDHDLGDRVFVNSDEENTGAGFVRWLIKHHKPQSIGQVIVHSMNPEGNKHMVALLNDAGFSVISMPFGPPVLVGIRSVISLEAATK